MTCESSTSRYTNQVLKVTFKEKKNFFYVPSFFLQDQIWLHEHTIQHTSSWKFSEQVGHVLIHYLYTGDYQPLDCESGNPEQSEAQQKLKIAVQVLLALGVWQFPKLQELVQLEIDFLINSIDIYDAVYIVDNELHGCNFHIKDELEEWLLVSLAKSLDEALEGNSVDRGDLSLFHKIHYVRLIKSLATKFFESYISQNPNTNGKLAQEPDIKSLDSDSESAVTLTPNTSPSDGADIKIEDFLENDFVMEPEEDMLGSNW